MSFPILAKASTRIPAIKTTTTNIDSRVLSSTMECLKPDITHHTSRPKRTNGTTSMMRRYMTSTELSLAMNHLEASNKTPSEMMNKRKRTLTCFFMRRWGRMKLSRSYPRISSTKPQPTDLFMRKTWRINCWICCLSLTWRIICLLLSTLTEWSLELSYSTSTLSISAQFLVVKKCSSSTTMQKLSSQPSKLLSGTWLRSVSITCFSLNFCSTQRWKSESSSQVSLAKLWNILATLMLENLYLNSWHFS